MTETNRSWTAADVPDQRDRIAVVAGANSGIGLEAARVLAERGAKVILACRNAEKAGVAREEIRAEHPKANIDVLQLDLTSLASIRDAAEELRSAGDHLDLLINNAGIMAVPKGRTADGFELQFGTNHLGHFALTGLLAESLLATPGARVVNISSGGHRLGKIDFDNLNWERGYGRWRAYGRSKLANLLFTYELQRRFEHAGANALSVAAHPGASSTNLGRRGPTDPGRWLELLRPLTDMMTQPAHMGALPTLRAATDPDAKGSDYYGPDGRGEMNGHPIRVPSSRAANDSEVAARLWQVSEELTGISYLPLK